MTKKVSLISILILMAVIIGVFIGWLIVSNENSLEAEPNYDTVILSGSYGAIDYNGLINDSDIIVKGVITQKGELYMPDMSLPQKYSQPDYVPRTDYTLEVSEVYKGSPAENIIVRVMGGTYDGIEYKLDRDPDLKVGDEYLLFLREGDMYKKSADDLHYEIIQVSAGCYPVSDDDTISDNGIINGDFNDLLDFLDS